MQSTEGAECLEHDVWASIMNIKKQSLIAVIILLTTVFATGCSPQYEEDINPVDPQTQSLSGSPSRSPYSEE